MCSVHIKMRACVQYDPTCYTLYTQLSVCMSIVRKEYKHCSPYVHSYVPLVLVAKTRLRHGWDTFARSDRSAPWHHYVLWKEWSPLCAAPACPECSSNLGPLPADPLLVRLRRLHMTCVLGGCTGVSFLLCGVYQHKNRFFGSKMQQVYHGLPHLPKPPA